MDVIYEFLLKNGFVFEMFVCNAMFCRGLKRRKYFYLRLAACFVVYLGVSIVWGFFETTYTPWDIVKFTMLFFMAIGAIKVCFEISFYGALFREIGAYATQHCAYKVGEIVRFAMRDYSIIAVNAAYIATAFAVWAASYLLFARRLKDNNDSYLQNKTLISVCALLLVFSIVFGLYYIDDSIEFYLQVNLYDVTCCALTLALQYSLYRDADSSASRALTEQVLSLQHEQFKQSKENIDLINVKCHDLKHQIARLEGKLDSDEVKELLDAVKIYDVSVKTGNEVLDVLLAQKGLSCEKQGVRLDCMADGAKLSFMRASDIYALFGNAIDNAVEAAGKLEDEGRRVVYISVRVSLGMLAVHIENRFDGKLTFNGGLPSTTKEDNRYHGFGMKSIRMIVEKYGGTLSIDVDGDLFGLNILFPLEDDEGETKLQNA